MPRLDLRGKRFGRLVVESHVGTRENNHIVWLCRCDCGNEKRVTASNLTCGNAASCGCLQRETRIRHGHGSRTHRTKTYRTWQSMIARCTNPRLSEWRYYGGRGITVCEHWRTFENFLADMGEKPPGRSIDRINNDGNYEPGNCRWATKFEQSINTRRTKLTASKAEEIRRLRRETGMPYARIAERFGISEGHARNVCVGLQWPVAADKAEQEGK